MIKNILELDFIVERRIDLEELLNEDV